MNIKKDLKDEFTLIDTFCDIHWKMILTLMAGVNKSIRLYAWQLSNESANGFLKQETEPAAGTY